MIRPFRAWQVVEERRDDNLASKDTVASTLKYQYVWGVRYIDAPICRDEDTSGDGSGGEPDGDCIDSDDEHLYYMQDANFNVTALVDGSDGDVVERYMYSPYGEVTVLDGKDGVDPDTTAGGEDEEWSTDPDGKSDYDNSILYCGYYHDSETGLYQVRYRYYHPPLGRWLSRDPIGYADGMGLYEYVGSAPPRYTDPTGLLECCKENEGARRCRVDDRAAFTVGPHITPETRKGYFELIDAVENVQTVKELGDAAAGAANLAAAASSLKGAGKAVTKTATDMVTGHVVDTAVGDAVGKAAKMEAVDSVPKAIVRAWEKLQMKRDGRIMWVRIHCEECQCHDPWYWSAWWAWTEVDVQGSDQSEWWYMCNRVELFEDVHGRAPGGAERDGIGPGKNVLYREAYNSVDQALQYLPACIKAAQKECEKKCRRGQRKNQ